MFRIVRQLCWFAVNVEAAAKVDQFWEVPLRLIFVHFVAFCRREAYLYIFGVWQTRPTFLELLFFSVGNLYVCQTASIVYHHQIYGQV